MAITRTIESWTHNFRHGSVAFVGVVADDVEGTFATKSWIFPDSVLPQALKDWEANVIASHNAVVAPKQEMPV